MNQPQNMPGGPNPNIQNQPQFGLNMMNGMQPMQQM